MSAGTAILPVALLVALVQVEAANRAYRRGEVSEAVAAYREAVEKHPEDATARYNLGTALLQDGQSEAALPHLARATEANPPELRARALYNLGTAHLSRAIGGDRESALRAVEAFRQSLLLRPEDEDAKWNLEVALRQLEEPPAPESPQSGPSGEEGGEGGAGAPPEASGAGSGQSDAQPGPASASPGRSSRAPRPQDLQPLPRATAEQILNAIEEQERTLQREKLRQQRPAGRPAGPDW